MFVFRKLVLKPSKNHSIFGIMQRLRGNPQKEAEIMQNRGVLHESRGIFQIPGGRIGKSPPYFQKKRFFALPSVPFKPPSLDKLCGWNPKTAHKLQNNYKNAQSSIIQIIPKDIPLFQNISPFSSKGRGVGITSSGKYVPTLWFGEMGQINQTNKG